MGSVVGVGSEVRYREAEFQGDSQAGTPSENCESCAFTSWFCFLSSFPLAEWGTCESGGRRDLFFLARQLPGNLAGDLDFSRSSSSPAEREPWSRRRQRLLSVRT